MSTRLRLVCLALVLAVTPVAAQQQGGLASYFSDDDALLPAEEAFPLTVEQVAPDVVVARWDTAEGYYLYRERLDFSLRGDDNAIAGFDLPEGKPIDDPNFGRMVIYEEPVAVSVRLEEPATDALTLIAEYQGCNKETGVCYPPLSSEVQLSGDGGGGGATSVAGATGGSGTAGAGSGPLAELLAGGHLWLTLGGFFAAGVLLAFTACMYPLIPILSGLIAGDGENRSGRRAFWLSLVFVQASAVAYAVAGAIAGLTGSAIQADLQSPLVLGGFAVLFAALALAMFGVYDIRIPAALQTRLDALSRRQRGGTFVGAGVMGALSALIMGACSGPALIAALAFISNTGDAALGGLALFAMGNGMGLPLLVVGTALGRWLPRSGPWMVRVKQLFGVLFLAVALWLLDRFLPGPVMLALWALLLAGVAVALGVLDRDVGTGLVHRGRQFAGLMLVLWSAVLLVGAAAGGGNFWQPLAPLASAPPTQQASQTTTFRDIDSLDELRTAVDQAAQQGQATVVDFYADWCVYCVQLEEQTFPDPAVRDALEGKQLLRVDVTDMTSEHRELLEALDVFLPPAVLFFGPDGEERRAERVVGFLEPGAFVQRTRAALPSEEGET